VLSKIVDGFSETAMSILLIQMATGWTLTFSNLDIEDSIEIFIPAIILIAMVHIIIATLTFVDIDAAHKHHDFAGLQGWILVVLKVIIYAYFLWCYITTRRKLAKRSEKYFQIFLLAASAYLLTIPFTVVATLMYAPYERQYVFILIS
jgi:hypothetical protein